MPRVAQLTLLLLALTAQACWAQQGGYADPASYRNEPTPASYDRYREPVQSSFGADSAAARYEPKQPAYDSDRQAPRQAPVQPAFDSDRQAPVQPAFDPFAEDRNLPAQPTRPSPPIQLPSEAEPAPLPVAVQQAAELTQPVQPAAPAARYTSPVVFQNAADRAEKSEPAAVQPAGLEVVEQEPQRLRPQEPEKSLKLDPPSKTASKVDAARPPSLITLLTSLTFVLGLFTVAAWVVKRGMPKSMNLLPPAAVEVLGRIPIAARQQAYLVRIGGKMILVCATPGGMETLTEITDPVEVDRLAGICQQGRKNSSSREFKQILQEFDTEPAPKTFLGAGAAPQIDFSSLGAINTSSSRGGRHG